MEDGVEISEADRIANEKSRENSSTRFSIPWSSAAEGKEDMIEALDSYEPKTLATMKDEKFFAITQSMLLGQTNERPSSH